MKERVRLASMVCRGVLKEKVFCLAYIATLGTTPTLAYDQLVAKWLIGWEFSALSIMASIEFLIREVQTTILAGVNIAYT